jgi:hypothetical protein
MCSIVHYYIVGLSHYQIGFFPPFATFRYQVASNLYQEIGVGCLFSGPKIKLPVTFSEIDCYAAK